MLMTRRGLLAMAITASVPPPRVLAAPQAKPSIQTIDDTLLASILKAGGWSETADDNGCCERLPESVIATIVGQRIAQPSPLSPPAMAKLGLLVLTLSVAEWGIAWQGSSPLDPAGKGWKGPPDIGSGKHLMSYARGGIGLPHLDTGKAERFFDALVARVPEASQDLQQFRKGFRYDSVRRGGGICPQSKIAVPVVDPYCKATGQMASASCTEFPHGKQADADGDLYCDQYSQTDLVAWNKLRHWCRVGLRRRDMQVWIIEDWINNVWVPAYTEVIGRPHGTLKEAFIVARIWSTSGGDATAALLAAGTESDPGKRIAAELARYGAGDATHEGRSGVMQRPWAAYDFFSVRQ